MPLLHASIACVRRLRRPRGVAASVVPDPVARAAVWS